MLEAGGTDWRARIKVPIGYGMTFFDPKVNWCYYSTPQKSLNNRVIYVPRGKVVGGSGSINAMVYLRGKRNDYEDWASFSNADLNWNSVNEVFDLIEGKNNPKKKNFISVSDVSDQHEVVIKNFFKAGSDLGFEQVDNLNSSLDEGLGHFPINTRLGVRWTSADAFLKPALKCSNVTILKNSHVTKLITENAKVMAIEFSQGRQRSKLVKVRLGAIMAAGAINTPQLLMLSGIGPPEILKKRGIEVVLEDKNIGKNLQDHLGIDYLYETSAKSLNQVLGSWKGQVQSILKYLITRRGAFSLSVNQGGGFVSWGSQNKNPNLQIYFTPLTYSITHNPRKRQLLKPDKFRGFVVGFQPCRPKSRGEILLRSADPFDSPIIDPNFLGSESDFKDVVAGIECVQALTQNRNLREIILQNKSINLNACSMEDKVKDFKNRAVSVYHPCGTCRMGKNPNNSSVSEEFKLRGLRNLWVVDASLFPNITSGNINAPTMMLAFKASEAIIKQIKNT